jgi:hypothetical protein
MKSMTFFSLYSKGRLALSWLVGLLLVLVVQTATLQGQSFQRLQPPVEFNGKVLSNAWGGGLNCPQFSEADFNNDGKMDLYVFDRVGNVHLTYLNDGKKFVYAPDYAANFPNLNSWVLLRDYNNDGIADIFAYSDIIGIDGITVYTGYYANNRLAFRRLKFKNQFNLLGYPLSTGSAVNLYVTGIDIPTIDDLDCDGDLDIATFNLGGGYVEYYKNQSVELGYRQDSVLYRLQDGCWGGFLENGLSSAVSLAPVAGQCFRQGAAELAVNYRHSGSTLMTFDADNDGDRELILGDIASNNLVYLHNGGNCKQAWMDTQDSRFPIYDQTLELPAFPAAFYVDVTGDGKKDIVASPNADMASEDRAVAWVYEGVGTPQAAKFRYKQDDFLTEDMIDLGSGANPVLVDYNADGLLDLVVGNFSVFHADGSRDPRLYLFENVGSRLSPSYKLVNDNWLNMMQYYRTAYSFAPAFGDMDGDKDLDIIVGEEFGQLFYAENIAGPGKPMQFGPFQYPFAGIDIGQASVPQIADLNGDNLPDLIVGERIGNVNFFQNVGTSQSPKFIADPKTLPNTERLGLIDTRKDFPVGHSSPVVFQQGGLWKILCGTESGDLRLYSVIEGKLTTAFTQETPNLGNINIGSRCRPALGDINSDGKMDLVLGNTRGGLSVFSTTFTTSAATAVREVIPIETLNFAPNPARDWIDIPVLRELNQGLLAVWDIQGRQILNQELSVGGSRLSIDNWAAGLYVIQIITKEKIFAGKLLKE